MISKETKAATYLDAIRGNFDRGYAVPQRRALPPVQSFITSRLGKSVHAVPVVDVAAIFARKPITRLPGALPECLGLVQLHGSVVPVYDLGLMLGYGPSADPDWLVLAKKTPVVFALARFDGHARVPLSDIELEEDGTEPAGQSIKISGKKLPIVRLELLLARLETQRIL